MITTTFKPPYYAVIFTSIRSEGDNGYSEMSDKMSELVLNQDGFLGFDSARQGTGITVSYWRDKESIKNWKENIEHSLAREKGRSDWYKCFTVRIALVEREYSYGL